MVYEAVRARGSMDMALPHGPDFFQFGSPERMRAGLEEAGFADAAAYSFGQDWHVANAAVTSNPFLAAPSARAPYSPPNRVLRRLAYGLTSPTI